MKLPWHRQGYLVLIALLSGIIAELILLGIGSLFHRNSPIRQLLGSISLLLLFLPAGLNFLFTKYKLNDETQVIQTTDQQGRLVIKRDYSTFLKIKNRIWTRIFFYGVIVTLLYVLIIEGFIWLK